MPLPPGLVIRVGTPGDAGFLQRLHEDSIRGLGPCCYSRAEVESWAAGLTCDGYVRAMTRGGESFLLAEPATDAAGRLAGFCSFAGDRICGLYVHPRWAGQGVAGALLAPAERAVLAAGHGTIRITASLPGLAFYEKHGYRVLRSRGWRTRGGLVLEAVEMEKRMMPSPAAHGRGRRPG
jgi:putative acetyltransferase